MEHVLTTANLKLKLSLHVSIPRPLDLYMYTGLMLHGAQWGAHYVMRGVATIPFPPNT